MKTNKVALTLQVLGVLVAVWLVINLVRPRGSDYSKAHIAHLRHEARDLESRELQKAHLQEQVNKMHLVGRTNRYTARIEYSDLAHWVVYLIPEKDTVFTNSRSWLKRILLIEFGKTNFPEIVIKSKAEKPQHPQFSNVSGKIQFIGMMTPPRPVGVILIDRRYEPPQRYILTVGQSRNNVTVVEIDKERKAVLVKVGSNEPEWIYGKLSPD